MTLCPQLRRLSGDHQRWLSELGGRQGAEEAEVGDLLALWDREILPHCRAEEEVLLPELARRLSEADALVVFTLGDHLLLRGLARDLRRSAGPRRPATEAAFRRKLEEHVAFEERTLLPALQETLGCGCLAELEGELAGARRRPPPSDPRGGRRQGTGPGRATCSGTGRARRRRS